MRWDRLVTLGAAVATCVALAGCGGGTGGSAATVSVRDVPGAGTVLVDAAGRTLYFTEQDSGGQVRCVAECASTWVPLTVPDGTIPTGGPGVTGALAVIARPDGGNQVTYDGRPLYTFAADGGAGRSTGNGTRDSFGGVDFVWHAAPASGSGSPVPDTGGGNGAGY
jgi:predicted lipoprotein with Yx(FWY)xxD motif